MINVLRNWAGKLIGPKGMAHLRHWKNMVLYHFGKAMGQVRTLLGQSSVKVPVRRFGEDACHVFFGYYDICPFSRDGQKLLANRLPKNDFSKSGTSPMEIGFYDLDQDPGGFHKIGTTTTWCAQQGARLQWIPGTGDRLVLYNAMVQGGYGCMIKDVQTKRTIRALPRPVYALSPDGKTGLSLNFSRLHRLRQGYGYSNLPDTTESVRIPEDDGIFRIDMEGNGIELLFSIRDIADFKPKGSMAGAEHYFNHLYFNPNGTRFMVFHIWVAGHKRYTRMITADLRGEDRYVLMEEGHVSHYFWLDNERLVAFSGHSDTGVGYHVYTDKTRHRYKIHHESLYRDGHPSVESTGVMVTDTYPDKWGNQSLMLFFPDQNRVETIGKFHSPPHLKGTLRCDLHPRWDTKGRKVCFDSAHEGNRAIYVADVSGYMA